MPVPVISIAEMRHWEKATWATGQTEDEVIRRVGRAVAQKAVTMTRSGDRILILAGKGNNGQDALCAREQLVERKVDVLQVAEPATKQQELMRLLSPAPALVIDGLFGIGISRPLSTDWCRLIQNINAAPSRILAVDVPSGLNADTGEPQGAAIRANVTLTVGAPKTGMLRECAWDYVGQLEVANDVGLTLPPQPGALQWTLPEDFNTFPPMRRAATHKGSYGHLAIVAGSVGYHGAAVLAARGAQRSQPGLITVHTLAYGPVASQLQAAMVSPWHTGTNLERPWSALLVGPGLAAADVPDHLKTAVAGAWRGSELPIVADASALDWLPREAVTDVRGLRVITPHPGEAARLLGSTAREVQANRVEALSNLSKAFGNIWVVLKGHQTLVGRNDGPVYVNCSGNPHLAQGGSGDLLSGYIAGLLAQPGLQGEALQVLRYAVWQHGHAADRLQSSGQAWVVEDLAKALGSAG